jgi:hypothetical protein
MASKDKIKCGSCGTAFKPKKPSQLFCDDCDKKRRMAKSTQVATPAPTVNADDSGRPSWLTTAVEHDPTTDPVLTHGRSAARNERHEKPIRPVQIKAVRPPVPLKPKPAKPLRETKPPKPPITQLPTAPTPEQVAAIEARYRELAQPEFDGIRTQIAQELHVPKHFVKRVIQSLREREHIPSWWEMQTFKGTDEELERIRAIYEKHLPTPPLGIHKQIAKELQMTAQHVYQGIRTVRMSLGLPIFNPPEIHPELLEKAANQTSAKARSLDEQPRVLAVDTSADMPTEATSGTGV